MSGGVQALHRGGRHLACACTTEACASALPATVCLGKGRWELRQQAFPEGAAPAYLIYLCLVYCQGELMHSHPYTSPPSETAASSPAVPNLPQIVGS